VSDLAIIGLVNAAYLVIVLAIGWAAFRRTSASADDYFLGGRAARTLVLFMALFGTNVTPFVLMGIPGLAYHQGIAVFGENAAIIALGVPLTFYLIGYPAYRAARRIGAITPAELFAERLASPAVGLLLFVAYFIYTVPYMVTGVLGAGLTIEVLSAGALPLAAGSGIVLAITLLYTSLGGMRATMWTNVFQGTVFLALMIAVWLGIAADEGGLQVITRAVAEARPDLLSKGTGPDFALGRVGSWGLAIALTVIGFPHVLVRLFAARDAAAIKNACRLYPPAMVLLWVPAVLLGVWGAVLAPGMVGKASDGIFPLLVRAHFGPAMEGLALAAILAAVMSTLDAQLLTLSSMLTRDVLPRVAPRLGAREVVSGRIFLLAIAGLVFAAVLARPASIFEIAAFSFSGYVTLVPTLFLGLRWRRFTAAGAAASVIAGNLALGAAMAGWLPAPGGVLPVAWGLAAAIVAGVCGSWASRPTAPEVLARVLGPGDDS